MYSNTLNVCYKTKAAYRTIVTAGLLLNKEGGRRQRCLSIVFDKPPAIEAFLKNVHSHTFGERELVLFFCGVSLDSEVAFYVCVRRERGENMLCTLRYTVLHFVHVCICVVLCYGCVCGGGALTKT